MEKTSTKDPSSDSLNLISRSPHRGLLAFWEGLQTPREGYAFMRTHKHLWKYAWWPIFINTIITLLVLSLLIYLSVQLYDWLEPMLPTGWMGGILQGLVILGMGVVLLGIGVGLALVLGNIFCSFFYGKLTYAVEIQMGASHDELKELSVVTEIRESIAALIELCVGNVLLLLLHFIPGLGSLLSALCTWLFDSYILGSEFLDYPLALRGWKRKERRKFARHHSFHTLGVGSVVLFFNLIPVIGAIILTTAVVGTVFLHRRLMALKPT